MVEGKSRLAGIWGVIRIGFTRKSMEAPALPPERNLPARRICGMERVRGLHGIFGPGPQSHTSNGNVSTAP